jgi:ABC-type Mn2+/Zn2+ transport systems, permease components
MSEAGAFAIALGLATALAAGMVGSFCLMKKMTLAGDVVSHLALPGLGAAFLWHVNPIAGAAVTVAFGIVLIHQLERRSGMAIESAIGVVFVAALAAGAILTPREDLIDALFGGFGEVTTIELAIGLFGCVAVMWTLYAIRHKLILVIFSPDMARALKIDVDRVNFIYLCTFGGTILLGLRFLGSLLVGALIIVPAATARRLSSSLNRFLILSCVASLVSVGTGFIASRYLHLALGPAIVGISSVMFALSLLKRS